MMGIALLSKEMCEACLLNSPDQLELLSQKVYPEALRLIVQHQKLTSHSSNSNSTIDNGQMNDMFLLSNLVVILIHMFLGNVERAKTVATKAIQTLPDCTALYRLRARCVIDTDRKLCVSDCTKIIELDPLDYFALLLKGQSAEASESSLREAIAALEQFVEIAPPGKHLHELFIF